MVVVGLTVVEPLADVEFRPPGAIEMLVAPVVDQLRVLLEPAVMLAGLAVKELIDGLLGVFTVTVDVDVDEPVALVAVSVYVVVVVGLTLVEPLPEVDVKLPGVMEMLVAPEVAQLRVLLEPEFMPLGFAANDVIVGSEPLVEEELTEPQLTSPAQAQRISKSRQLWKFAEPKKAEMCRHRKQELLDSMNRPHG